jgi:putative transposase
MESMMTTLQRGFKGEVSKQLDSNAAQTFAQWIGCYSVIWDCKVAENLASFQDYLREKSVGQDVKKPKPNQAVAHFKTPERPWLAEAPSQIRRNAGTKFLEAFNACLKGLRSIPSFKGKYGKKNCLVTNELFEGKLSAENIQFSFKRSAAAKPFCTIVLPKNNKLIEIPKMVWLRRRGSRFWLSYSYSADMPEVREERTIIEQLSQAPLAYQAEAVVGLDVGVKKPIALSTELDLGYTTAEIAALQRKNTRRLRYQRRLSRQREMSKKRNTAPGKNYQKTRAKLTDTHANITYLRINMAHRVSKQVAELPVEVVVCEKLNISNMTKRPKAKQDPSTGAWLVNGASRKAGLNKSILNVGWGRILNFISYKLRERDKLLIQIPSAYSSQECVSCRYISPKNRQTQDIFCCIGCGHTANADFNAAGILKKRFLERLNAGTFVLPTKTVKRISIRKQREKAPPELRCRSVELM